MPASPGGPDPSLPFALMILEKSIDKINFMCIIKSNCNHKWFFVSLYFSKTLMVLLVCLTFVGQSMASAVMPYQMMNMKGMNTEQTHNMEKMTHGSHHMSDDSIANDSDDAEGCCAKTCNCSIGGCSSVATLTKVIVDDLIFDYSAKIHSISSLAQSQQLKSLYRPPILS